jgi:hypothetical protein
MKSLWRQAKEFAHRKINEQQQQTSKQSREQQQQQQEDPIVKHAE